MSAHYARNPYVDDRVHLDAYTEQADRAEQLQQELDEKHGAVHDAIVKLRQADKAHDKALRDFGAALHQIIADLEKIA